MAFALIANTTGKSTNGNTFTTSAIDTRGANLIVIGISKYPPGGTATLSDNQGNTWATAQAQQADASNLYSTRLMYVYAPTTNASHTFTLTGSSFFGAMAVMAFSGSDTSPLDQHGAAAGAGGTTAQPGSLTPSADNEVLVTHLAKADGNFTVAIDGGFTITDQWNSVSGQCQGGAFAYLIQTSAAAANPSWSWLGTKNAASSMATFKAAAVAGGQPTMRRWGGSIQLTGGRRIGRGW